MNENVPKCDSYECLDKVISNYINVEDSVKRRWRKRDVGRLLWRKLCSKDFEEDRHLLCAVNFVEQYKKHHDFYAGELVNELHGGALYDEIEEACKNR